MNRDFKGVWIPKEVWLDTRLNALDKIILVEIDSLDNGKDGCFASNKYLAEFCQCSESKVSKSISTLIEFGYVYVASFNGRQRNLRSSLSKNANLPSKIYEADSQKMLHNNINNNLTNNKMIIKNNNQLASEFESEFDELWKLYPKKQGKANARKAYIKARKNGTEKAAIEAGLTNYNHYVEVNRIDPRFIKQGSTWFTQECWNDEYIETRSPDIPAPTKPLTPEEEAWRKHLEV